MLEAGLRHSRLELFQKILRISELEVEKIENLRSRFGFSSWGSEPVEKTTIPVLVRRAH